MRFVLLLLLLAGCSTMERLESGRYTIKDELTVTADARWNRLEGGRDGAEVWTADGTPLDVLAFYVGVAEGETLGAAPSDYAPRFRTTMSPHDIVELYEALVTQEGSEFRLERLGPAAFGGRPGFVFEHTTVMRDGPALGGIAYGTVAGGRLYLLSYTAPTRYFFEKNLDQVRAIAASAQITSRESEASASP
jgi:hypothetical protein